MVFWCISHRKGNVNIVCPAAPSEYWIYTPGAPTRFFCHCSNSETPAPRMPASSMFDGSVLNCANVRKSRVKTKEWCAVDPPALTPCVALVQGFPTTPSRNRFTVASFGWVTSHSTLSSGRLLTRMSH